MQVDNGCVSYSHDVSLLWTSFCARCIHGAIYLSVSGSILFSRKGSVFLPSRSVEFSTLFIVMCMFQMLMYLGCSHVPSVHPQTFLVFFYSFSYLLTPRKVLKLLDMSSLTQLCPFLCCLFVRTFLIALLIILYYYIIAVLIYCFSTVYFSLNILRVL